MMEVCIPAALSEINAALCYSNCLAQH